MNGEMILGILRHDEKPGTKLWNMLDAPPQFLALKSVQQDPIHHPEQSLHFPLVIDNMRKLLNQEGKHFSPFEQDCLMLGALCHDLGKVPSTFWNEKKNRYCAYGHEISGIPITEELLNQYDLNEYIPVVSKLVLTHMSHCVKNWSEKSVRKLIDKLSPAKFEYLVFLMKADCASRPPLNPDLPDSVLYSLIPIHNNLYGVK